MTVARDVRNGDQEALDLLLTEIDARMTELQQWLRKEIVKLPRQANGSTSARGIESPSRAMRIGGLLRVWIDRHAGRRELLALDDVSLKDIGMTRIEAQREAVKAFWHE